MSNFRCLRSLSRRRISIKSLIERRNQLMNDMDEKEQFIVALASEKRSSNWLNALPPKKIRIQHE